MSKSCLKDTSRKNACCLKKLNDYDSAWLVFCCNPLEYFQSLPRVDRTQCWLLLSTRSGPQTDTLELQSPAANVHEVSLRRLTLLPLIHGELCSSSSPTLGSTRPPPVHCSHTGQPSSHIHRPYSTFQLQLSDLHLSHHLHPAALHFFQTLTLQRCQTALSSDEQPKMSTTATALSTIRSIINRYYYYNLLLSLSNNLA